jgi:hypothetical protein
MSKELIIIISEGERTEKQIVENLKQNFFNGALMNKGIEFLSFKTNIYTLWKQLKKDEFETEIVEVMREWDAEAAKKLEEVNKESISEIYLFFDYDGHAHQKEEEVDQIVQEMIEVFDNETEHGKIYISYPMVEAVKHLKKNDPEFKDCCVPAKQNINYKNLVSQNTDFCHLTSLSVDDWHYIMYKNLKKANHMFCNSFSIPEYSEYRNHFNQSSLFQCQLSNYINKERNVAVLSGFPFFLLDYFGENLFLQLAAKRFEELGV